MKSHEKESIHLIALSPNISSLEDENKVHYVDPMICNEKKNQIFYMLWQYKKTDLCYLQCLPRYASKC